jgi:predicted metal-dependent phosphoesterase TrpH
MLQGLRASSRLDLHMHSARSDGRYSPEEVLARCSAGGLDVVSLTDHDLATAIPSGGHTIGGRPIHVVAGAEISGTHRGQEHHLLVYFPDTVPHAFLAFCTEQVRARLDRYDAAIRALGLTGVEVADEAAHRGDLSLTRHHLARALVAAGHARDLRDAFARFAGDASVFVPPLPTAFVDAVRIARLHGGVTSWAHPPAAAVREHLAAFVSAGLQGLEGLRPRLTSADRRFYRTMAQRFGLFVTGGSDWHGWHDDDLGLFAVEQQEVRGFVSALGIA